MPIELKMPALSPTMEEGTLSKWLVKEGDSVTSGDILAEIETDKATMEFEAIDEGTIAQILVAEGTDNVKVGTVIAIIAAEGEDANAPVATASVAAPAPVAEATPVAAATKSVSQRADVRDPAIPEGTDNVKVGTVIAIIAAEGEMQARRRSLPHPLLRHRQPSRPLR